MGFPRGLCISAVGAVEQSPLWISGLQPDVQGFHSSVPRVGVTGHDLSVQPGVPLSLLNVTLDH